MLACPILVIYFIFQVYNLSQYSVALMLLSYLSWLGLIVRVVQRRSSSQPQARMLPCLLWVSTSMNTSLSLTSFPTLAALPTAWLLLQRLFYRIILSHTSFYIILSNFGTSCIRIHFIILIYLVSFLQVINDRFGIVEGLMTTVHSITGGSTIVSFLSYYSGICFIY